MTKIFTLPQNFTGSYFAFSDKTNTYIAHTHTHHTERERERETHTHTLNPAYVILAYVKFLTFLGFISIQRISLLPT